MDGELKEEGESDVIVMDGIVSWKQQARASSLAFINILPSDHRFNVTHTRFHPSSPNTQLPTIQHTIPNPPNQTISLLVFLRLSLLLGLLLNLSNLPSETPSLPTLELVSLSLRTSASPFLPFFSILSSSGSINR